MPAARRIQRRALGAGRARPLVRREGWRRRMPCGQPRRCEHDVSLCTGMPHPAKPSLAPRRIPVAPNTCRLSGWCSMVAFRARTPNAMTNAGLGAVPPPPSTSTKGHLAAGRQLFARALPPAPWSSTTPARAGCFCFGVSEREGLITSQGCNAGDARVRSSELSTTGWTRWGFEPGLYSRHPSPSMMVRAYDDVQDVVCVDGNYGAGERRRWTTLRELVGLHRGVMALPKCGTCG